MTPCWILVCNSARARFFEIADDASWHLVDMALAPETLRNPAKFEQYGLFEHYALERSGKGVQRTQFVSSLVAKLDQASRIKRFDRWVLVASPHFLSTVTDVLTHRLREQLLRTVDRDLNHLDERNLAERLRYSIPDAAQERTG